MVIDKEKLYKALDCCSARPKDCDICPYFGYKDPDGDDFPNCEEKVKINAMIIIKGQQAVEPKHYESTRYNGELFACGDCKHWLEAIKPKFCPYCGKEVKWND